MASEEKFKVKAQEKKTDGKRIQGEKSLLYRYK